MDATIGFGEKAETHRVVYIEYIHGRPHSVITHTPPHAFNEYWDAWAEAGDRKDIRLYNSGGGGHAISLPKFDDGNGVEIWVAAGVKTKGKTNATIIKHPKRVKGYHGFSQNPFTYGEVVDSSEWCDRCGHTTTEYCRDHQYEDDNGDLRYRDDSTLVY